MGDMERKYSWQESRKAELEWKDKSQGRGRVIVTLVARFHGIYDNSDEGIYDNYDKFRHD